MACVKSIPGHGDGAHQVSDASADETCHFAAVYLSVCRIVIETIADGSCGVDVMCLMLGLRRAKDVRRAVRWELGAFLLKHCGTRALVQSMFTLGEVDRHMGLFELEAAGAVLLADETTYGDDSAGGSSQSGGGSSSSSPGHGAGAARSFTAEEVLALRWKCRFQNASPEAVLNVLRALPEWCVEQIVNAYQNKREPETP